MVWTDEENAERAAAVHALLDKMIDNTNMAQDWLINARTIVSSMHTVDALSINQTRNHLATLNTQFAKLDAALINARDVVGE